MPARTSLAGLPLHFEENRGQADRRFNFISRAGSYALLLGQGEATLILNDLQRSDLGLPDKKSDGSSAVPERPQSQVRITKQSVLRMKLIGANASARIVGLDPLAVKTNYFIGDAPEKWHTDVPSYTRVKYEEVYPGIDLVFYGNQGQLEYDFIVAPGATPDLIRLAFEGADRIDIDDAGHLVLETPVGRVQQHKPAVYQENGGVSEAIDCRYVIGKTDEIGFNVGSFNAARALVIDPVMSYSTFLGGENQDLGNDVATDAEGNVYITGVIPSADFPVASAFQPALRGTPFSEAFVAKLNPSGTQLIYSTFLGGDGADESTRIEVDSAGNAYVIGLSGSTDFPTTPGSIQPGKTTIYGRFIAKISPGGDALEYSTYFRSDFLNDIAVDRGGNAYLTGSAGAGFPITPGAFQTQSKDNFDAFLAKLNSSGSSLVYSTYIGGSEFEFGQGVAVDGAGNAYVTGYTDSSDFPTTNGAFQTNAPERSENLVAIDAFVTKLNTAGSRLVYSTLIAGNRLDKGLAVAVDAAGSAYVTGETNSLDFPTTAATLQTEFSGGVLKTNNGGDKWKGSNIGLKTPDVTNLAIDRKTSTIYAATEAGLFKSTDKGGRWVAANLIDFEPVVLAVDPVNPLVLYAGAFVGPVHKSTNGGVTWNVASNGLPANFRVTSLIVDEKNPSIVYAAGAGFGGPGQSPAARTGETQPTIPPVQFWRVLFISTDAGATWVESPSVGLPRFPAITLAQNARTNSIYLSSEGLLHRSNDGGTTWSSLNLNRVFYVVVDPGDPATLYAGTQTGVFKSGDEGQNWAAMNNGLPPETLVNVLAIDPENPTTIFAGTPDGVFKSVDGAKSWTATLIGGEIRTLALDPSDPETVYTSVRDSSDAFLTKLNPTGTSAIYSTFLGGRSGDSGFGIAVSAAGSAYLTGQTFSANYPTLAALQAKRESVYAAFITKLNSSGDAYSFSTYLGGGPSRSRGTTANGIALGSSGVIYVVGATYSPDFPTLNALQPVFGGGFSDCFLAKFVEPRINRVSVQGKDLIVQGEFFDPGAEVLLNGKVRKTTPDLLTPTSTLIAGKAGKKIKPGKSALIQVRNSNGEVSEPFLFAPSGPGIASRGLLIEESRVAGLHACLPSSRSEGSKPAIGNPGSATLSVKL